MKLKISETTYPKEWAALPEIKRLFIYIDAYQEAIREEWD